MNPVKTILESALTVLSGTHNCVPVPSGKYRTIRLYGIMKFNVQQYKVEELGNLCTMTMFFGPMKMLTFVLTPYSKDLPMLSVDYICAGKNRKAYVETYDLTADTAASAYQGSLRQLQAVLDEFGDLQTMEHPSAELDRLLTVCTYRQGTEKQDGRFKVLFDKFIAEYGKTAAALPAMTDGQKAAKREIIGDYCGKLVENGGVSTNMFKKALGEETVRDFYNTVFFAPADY